MASVEADYFRELPSLTSDAMVQLAPGCGLPLLMMVYVGDGDFGALFPLEYIHRELIYRTPGGKDAVAFGTARLEGWGEFEDVRILFSRPHLTATLRGRSLEGHVKAQPGNSFDPASLHHQA